MKNNSIKINIPNPCPENWDQMSPKGDGRFCVSCEKVVVDFSVMSNDQIKEYFLKNKDKGICGHIVPSKINFGVRVFHSFYAFGHEKIRSKYLQLMFVGLVGSIMFLFGCKKKVVEYHTTGVIVEKPVPEEVRKKADYQFSRVRPSNILGFIKPLIVDDKEDCNNQTDSL